MDSKGVKIGPGGSKMASQGVKIGLGAFEIHEKSKKSPKNRSWAGRKHQRGEKSGYPQSPSPHFNDFGVISGPILGPDLVNKSIKNWLFCRGRFLQQF